MNSNLFRYSSRFMAVAAAAVVFASCEKDQFTEKNALDLELTRLRTQDSIANVIRTQQQKHDIKLLQYQRQIDSLAAIDAGGKVYYTVVPVNATLGVFSAGGRVEEAQGEAGCTVTASQYGQVVNAVTSGTSGVYAFPVLHSGEVTLTVVKAGFSTLNYTANLTPDGPVANGKIVYVGNVVPIFVTDAADTQLNRSARIQGKAWVETNLTNGVEEIPTGYQVTAQIDTERQSGGRSVFRTRFTEEFAGVDEAQGVTQPNQGSASTTRSGFLQKFAYELPLSRATVDANGDYSMIVPASTTGLPIKFEASEFAADRIFFRNDRVVTARHIYGPNVAADAVENGVTQPTLTFQAVRTAAVATVSYTPRTTGTTLTTGIVAANGNVTGTTTNPRQVVVGADPTIAVTGTGGSGATARVANKVDYVYNGTTGTLNHVGAVQFISSAATTQTSVPYIVDFEVNNAGSGFTANGTATITYNDVFTIGTARQVSSGASSGISQEVRISNGGFGFFPPADAVRTLQATGAFTGRLPLVEFVIGGQIPVGVTQPAASVVIDQTVGAVSFVRVESAGAGFTQAPDVRFRYAFPGTFSISSTLNNPLLVLGTDGRSLAFNTLAFGGVGGANGTVFTSITNQLDAGTVGTVSTGAITFTTGGSASKYVFVPGAAFSIVSSTNTVYSFTPAQVSVDVSADRSNTPTAGQSAGTITRVNITGGDFSNLFQNITTGTFTTALRSDVTLTLSFGEPTNTLAAYPTTLSGSGLNNYSITFNATPGGVNATNPGTGSTTSQGGNVPSFNFTSAGFITGSFVSALSEGQIIQLIQAAPYLVAVAAPDATNVAASARTFAWGVPVYQNGAISGVRLIAGGNGYQSNRDYTLFLIPNAYRGLTALSQLPTSRDIKAVIDSRPTSFAVQRTQTAAIATVTLTNQGAGYAEVPRIVIFDGGIEFNASNELSTEVTGRLRITSNGSIEFTGANGGSATGSSATVYSTNTNAVPGNNNTRAYLTGSTISTVIVDRLGESLTEEFANPRKVAGQIVINEAGQVGSINITPNRQINFVENGVALTTVARGWAAFTPLTYNQPPTLTISSPTGTGATAVIDAASSTLPTTNPINSATGLNPVFVDANGAVVTASSNAQRVGFQIRTIRVTAGGSGYQQGNWFHRSGVATGGTTGNQGGSYGSAAAAAQNFRVIGGVQGSNFDLAETNGGERNDRFDVFTGITYVRDIHLGTGHEVE